MTATFAPSRWPLPADAARNGAWRFGRVVHLPGTPGQLALQWLLRRNCSISPRQMGLAYLSLCALALGVGLFFFTQGAPYVLGFAVLELLALGVALLAFARHVGDCETLTLVGRLLQVERRIGNRVERAQFAAEWLRVEPVAGQGSLVELSARGQRLCVGRFLRADLRAPFARELRQALRRATGPAV
jgi:uncharacterized membrane protein